MAKKATLEPCPKCRSTNLVTYEIKAGYGEIVCEDCGFTYPRDACFGVDMMTPEELTEGWNGLANKGVEDGHTD